MNFDDYQIESLKTIRKSKVDPLLQQTIWALGVAGESGEVIEKWKKIIAYNDGNMTEEDRIEIVKELGDVIWYITVFADSLGFKLSEVIERNLSKLQDRQERNVIAGKGDNR